MIPGTPSRTGAYLAFYALIAVLALGWLAQVTSSRWTLVVAAGIVVLSLAAGLPMRVRVEPAAWRRLCRARNVALCAALLFCAADVLELVWFIVAISGWRQ